MGKKIFALVVLCFALAPTASRAEIYRFFQVEENIFRGSHPEDIDDLFQIQALGVKTIVDLRELDSDTAAYDKQAADLGMNVQHFPISSFDALRGKEPPDEIVNGALAAIAKNTSENRVFVHCHAGKDRTGLLVGLVRVFTQHWDPKTSHDEMIKFDFDTRLQKGLETYYWKRVAKGH